jgi:uncharacterized protein
MRVVIDTNVVVSGLIKPSGPCATILRPALTGRIEVILDSRILEEYVDVTNRPRFGFDKESIDIVLDYFRREGYLISTEPVAIPFVDEDDRILYEALVSGDADYLVTGNTEHFPRIDRIISPRKFVNRYVE